MARDGVTAQGGRGNASPVERGLPGEESDRWGHTSSRWDGQRVGATRQDEKDENVRRKGRDGAKGVGVTAGRREGPEGRVGLPGGETTPNVNTNYSPCASVAPPAPRRFIPRTDTANHVGLSGLTSTTTRRQCA